MIALLLLALAPRDEVTDLIAKLRAATDATSQYQLGNSIERVAKPGHVPILVKEVDAGPPFVRKQLIPALARINTKDSQAALRGLCQRNDIGSRAQAAQQLRWMEDDTGLKTLVALLSKAETDDDKREVLNGLHGYFSEGGEAVPALVRFLEKEKKDELRRIAIEVLGSHKDPAALPALRKIAANEKDELRYDAMAQLVRKGDEAAMDGALKALEEGKSGTLGAYHLVSAIEMSGKRTVLPRLREILEKSEDRTVRTTVIRALATMKDDKSIPLLSKLTEDKDVSVAREALEAIIKLAGRSQLELLRKVTAEGDAMRRLEAAEALLQLDLKEGLEGVKAELENAKMAYRTQAVQILSKVRRKESVDLLLPLLDDKEEYVQKNVRQAVLSTLAALFPYLKFDPSAAPEKLRAWWEKNRPK